MNNKEIVKYFYEVIVSENKLEELSRFIAEDCTLKIGEEVKPLGVEGMKQHLLSVKNTYPDYTMKIIRQYTDENYVISEFIMVGTHKGMFAGIKPTNKQLVFTGIDVDKVIDGKIAEHGGATNTFETFIKNNLIRPV